MSDHRELQNTNYNDATISSELAAELKRQPVAEILRFEEHGGETVVQTRLPEKGAWGNPPQKFDIRINMNYLTRGFARAVMDKDGDIDPKKVAELNTWNSHLLKSYPVDLEGFMDKLDIPKNPERRADFTRFLAANQITKDSALSSLLAQVGPVSIMTKEVFGQLMPYQNAVSGQLGAEA